MRGNNMTKAHVENIFKRYWQAITTLVVFTFTVTGFIFETRSYSGEIKQLKDTDKKHDEKFESVIEKQSQYSTDIAVIKSKLENIDKNIERMSK